MACYALWIGSAPTRILRSTRFLQWPQPTYNRWGSDGGEAPPTAVNPVPFQVMMQLANMTNKRPWLNIPHAFCVAKPFSIIGVTKSSPGSNAILTTGVAGSPFSIPTNHNFLTGDQVIVNAFTTGVGNPFFTNASASISLGSNNVTWAAHEFTMLGNRLYFPSGGGNTNAGQTYYVATASRPSYQLIPDFNYPSQRSCRSTLHVQCQRRHGHGNIADQSLSVHGWFGYSLHNRIATL